MFGWSSSYSSASISIFFLQQLLDVGHQARIAARDQRHRQARGPGTARTADTVHIVFGIEGHIEVEHRRHILDVQATRGHVGADQQVHFAALEGFERLEALVLAFVAVQRGGLEAFALQAAGQACAAELAVDEDEGLLDPSALEHLVDGVALALIIGAVEVLLHRGRGLVGPRHLDGDRVLQVAACQALDLGREGGPKQQRGALFGQVREDALQVGQKTDVEHAVGLVEHHVLHLVQHRVLGLDVVEQPPGRGHQHLDTLFQLQRLGFHVHAAEHHGAAQLGVLGIQGDLLGDLVGQFTRGQQHQGAHRVARGRGGTVLVLEQALQQRQREGRRLAGAGLGCAHHILAGQNHRNGLLLDGGHGLVAHFGHGACQRFSQRKIGKGTCH